MAVIVLLERAAIDLDGRHSAIRLSSRLGTLGHGQPHACKAGNDSSPGERLSHRTHLGLETVNTSCSVVLDMFYGKGGHGKILANTDTPRHLIHMAPPSQEIRRSSGAPLVDCSHQEHSRRVARHGYAAGGSTARGSRAARRGRPHLSNRGLATFRNGNLRI
jgi:hypothetical protein